MLPDYFLAYILGTNVIFLLLLGNKIIIIFYFTNSGECNKKEIKIREEPKK
jgi:hypothetical protein